MRQRRISGVGGFSQEAIDNSETDYRIFWVMSYLKHSYLYTKKFVYTSDLSSDPVDTRAGISYYLGYGDYQGMSWCKLTDSWAIVYSVNGYLNVIRVNPDLLKVYEQKSIGLRGVDPLIFSNATYTNYYLSFLKLNLLYISTTTDFVTFTAPKLAYTYSNNFNNYFVVGQPEVNLNVYFTMNEHIKSNLDGQGRIFT